MFTEFTLNIQGLRFRSNLLLSAVPSTAQELLPRKDRIFPRFSRFLSGKSLLEISENRRARSFCSIWRRICLGSGERSGLSSSGGSGEGERGRGGGGGGSSRALEEDGDAGSWLGLRKSPPLWF